MILNESCHLPKPDLLMTLAAAAKSHSVAVAPTDGHVLKPFEVPATCVIAEAAFPDSNLVTAAAAVIVCKCGELEQGYEFNKFEEVGGLFIN